jgi:hypothetical protein
MEVALEKHQNTQFEKFDGKLRDINFPKSVEGYEKL